MRTKMFLAGTFAVVLSFMLPSCSVLKDPETWAVEIEDSFRAQLALTFSYVIYDEDVVDAFVDKLDAEAEKAYDESGIKEADCPKYKLALEKMAKDDELAADFLKGYNSFDVEFSEWKEQPQEDGYSVWTSTEQNTGITVTFKNNSMLEWSLELDEETLMAYCENLSAALTNCTQQQPATQSSDKWLLKFWKDIMGDDFGSEDEQYLKKEYPSGVTTEKIVLKGEYIDDEDKEEIIPTEDVIINVFTNHYNIHHTAPAPECVGEYFAKIYKKDYYKHIDAEQLCYAYSLCQELKNRGEFDNLLQDIEEQIDREELYENYPLDPETIKTAKTQQDKDICKVLNAWAYIALGDGGLDPTLILMGKHF